MARTKEQSLSLPGAIEAPIRARPHDVAALAELQPSRATAPMPREVRQLLRTSSVDGAGEKLGAKQFTVARAEKGKHKGAVRAVTEPKRHAWLDLEYLPRLVPFRSPRWDLARQVRHYVEPLTMHKHSGGPDEAMRFSYPWCTIGQVLVGHTLGTQLWSGSGVLVGRNLMLTASHVAPWNRGPGQWWMRFVPGRRILDEPHGSSYVEAFFGTYSDPANFEASGKDYVICKLFTPLGNALGWMGSRSFGSESDYYSRRFISVGYPGYFGDKPAVHFDIDIDDIDSDSPGLELETTYPGSPQDDGWSGGPLWMWENERPFVVGILSGSEKDELDPRRHVWGGGGLLVDRVKHGITHWS